MSRYLSLWFFLPLIGLMLASCVVPSGGNGVYYAPGTTYSYNRLNPDDFTGHGHEGGRNP